MRVPYLVTATALLLGACTAGPDYAGPPALGSASPAGQFARAGEGALPSEPALAQWWTALGDPVLDQLEARALEQNPGIAVAQARVRQARSSVRQARADRLPQLAASGMYVHAELPGADLGGSDEDGDGGAAFNLFNLGLNANWELEFAGGQRRNVEAANARVAAAVANVADAQVQLTAELAQAYVNLRERQNRLQSLRAQQALHQQAVDLAQQRFESGTTAAFEVEQAHTALEGTATDIVAAEIEQDIYLNAVAVLTGSAPGGLDALLAPVRDVPLPPAQVGVGDPGLLLQRRPDVRAAERNIAAATARIGVAEAARYPRVSFMGILGLGGTSPEDLLDPGKMSTIAMPQIQWSFLDFGRTRAQIEQTEAALDEAEAQYRQTVLAALQDAEDSLARFGRQRQTVAALARTHASAQRTAQLMRQRYDAGVAPLSQSLDAERQALVAEQNLRAASAALTGSYIAVQKSLGLGWREAAEQG